MLHSYNEHKLPINPKYLNKIEQNSVDSEQTAQEQSVLGRHCFYFVQRSVINLLFAVKSQDTFRQYFIRHEVSEYLLYIQ